MAPKLWRHVEPMLAAAFDRTCDSTIEAVEADVKSGLQLLWVGWDGSKIVAAATTSLNRTPRHKICIVTSAGLSGHSPASAGLSGHSPASAGGVHSRLWDQFMPMVEQFAKAEGCALVRVMGRKGWSRVLDGYEQPWIVLDKRV